MQKDTKHLFRDNIPTQKDMEPLHMVQHNMFRVNITLNPQRMHILLVMVQMPNIVQMLIQWIGMVMLGLLAILIYKVIQKIILVLKPLMGNLKKLDLLLLDI